MITKIFFSRRFRPHVYLRDQSIVTNTWSDAWHITVVLPAQQCCAQTISANDLKASKSDPFPQGGTDSYLSGSLPSLCSASHDGIPCAVGHIIIIIIIIIIIAIIIIIIIA